LYEEAWNLQKTVHAMIDKTASNPTKMYEVLEKIAKTDDFIHRLIEISKKVNNSQYKQVIMILLNIPGDRPWRLQS
jgi:hypothetical protein